MKANSFSLQTFYLRWAGLVSAVLGLFAFFLILLAYREQNPSPKLLLGIFGLVGALVSYAIGKDIIDRIRNHEGSAVAISNQQARYAYIGTRFIFLLVNIVLFIALASVVVFSIPVIERTAIFCSGGADFWRCVHDFTGIPSE